MWREVLLFSLLWRQCISYFVFYWLLQADGRLTQDLRMLHCSPSLYRNPEITFYSEQRDLSLPKECGPILQSFLTFFLLVITFGIHASGIMETYSKSLVGKKEPLNFSWTQLTSQFFLPHLEVLEISLMTRYYLEKLWINKPNQVIRDLLQ